MEKFKVGFEEGSHIILNYLQSFVDVDTNCYFETNVSSLKRSYYLVIPRREGKLLLKFPFSERNYCDLFSSALRHQGYWVQKVQIQQDEEKDALYCIAKCSATYEMKGKVKRIR